VFDKISRQQQQSGNAQNPLDLPFLAEAMLFYGRVEVVANPHSVTF
jgi:hypothetical protein